MNFSGNCWPTPLQEMLLKAGLMPFEEASSAWESYSSAVDLQNIDRISSTFLPLVYHNLRRRVDLNVCKSVYCHTWSRNHLHFFKLKKALQALRSCSIDTCLLKGAAMIARYYRDPGLRAMGDIDILVPELRVKEALKILAKLGWSHSTPERSLDKFIRRSHAIMLQDADGHSLDLHWTILSESRLDPLLASYTPRTEPLDAFHCQSKCLQAEDLLLHTLFHGLRYSSNPLIRWVADATLILKNTPMFDWDHFHAQAKRLQIQGLVYPSLAYLQERGFAATVRIGYTPTAQETRYCSWLARKHHPLANIFQTYWHCHVRNSRLRSPFLLLLTFPSFVKGAQKFSSWIEFLPFVARGLLTHLQIKECK